MGNHLGLKKQLIVGFTLIAFLVTTLGSFVSFFTISRTVREMVFNDLDHLLSGAETAIQVSSQESIESQARLMRYWHALVSKSLVVANEVPHDITMVNQNSQEKIQTKIPAWHYNGLPVETHPEIITQIGEFSARSVSFLMLLPEGLLRVATNVKNADGTSSNYTFIPSNSAVYKSIADGKAYSGRAKVVDQWYLTNYEPLIKDGKVIGAFFIGMQDTASERVKAHLRKQKILDTGYFYILDSKGNFVLHPSREGENVLEVQDLDGKYIFKDIIQAKSGTLQYRWLNTETQKAQDKFAVFKYHPELDWYIAASINTAEVDAPVYALSKFLILLTLGSSLVMFLVAWAFGSSITKKLSSISQVLQTSSEEVKSSIQQLTQAGNALSHSSSNTAASLEETVASLEEINSMVATNAQHAKQAASLSQEASMAAENGEKEIKDLFHSIQEMAESSKKIQEINGVIDDIAFQTNLLALNAAVEAARAGEQGRGFAVVAEAVRALAQRSSQSAKEISQLINLTAEQMQQGTRIASKSSESLAKIVESIRKVSDINSEISAASSEQASGIQQINTAMSQLDASSQTNAASAEQIAATSGNLQDQNAKVATNVVELQSYMSGRKKSEAA